MDYGEKFTDIVGGALHGAEVEYSGSGRQVDALVFHGAWISETGGVDGPGFGIDFREVAFLFVEGEKTVGVGLWFSV